jgi:hypothetical protein
VYAIHGDDDDDPNDAHAHLKDFLDPLSLCFCYESPKCFNENGLSTQMDILPLFF